MFVLADDVTQSAISIWEHLGIVSVLMVLGYLMLTGKIVPGWVYTEMLNRCECLIVENKDLRELAGKLAEQRSKQCSYVAVKDYPPEPQQVTHVDTDPQT